MYNKYMSKGVVIMISDVCINNMKRILNSSEKIDEILDKEMKKSIYDKDEKEIIYFIELINSKLYNYSYKNNPYIRLMDFNVKQRDIQRVLDILEENELKAKMYDYLWIRFKSFDSSQKAYEIYKDLSNSKVTNVEYKFHYILRMFDIYIGTGKNKEKLIEIKCVVDFYINTNIEDHTAKTLNLLEMFVEEKIYEYDFLLRLANMKLSLFKGIQYSNIGEKYYVLMEKLICKKYNSNVSQLSTNSNVIDIRRRKVNYLISLARNSAEYSKVKNYKKVIKELKMIPNTEDERRNIVKEMEPYQKHVLKNLQEFSYSMDVTKEVKKIIELLKGKDLREVLAYYVLQVDFIKKDKLMIEVKENEKEFSLSSLFPKVFLDKKGKVKYKMPSIFPECTEKSILANAENEYLQYVNIYAQTYIEPILKYIYNEFKVDEKILNNIVENNIFIPKARKSSFVKGLLAGFNLDYISSLSILIPQVENALRCLSEECGDIIYKINEDGIEELITFNGILDLPKLNEVMNEDFIFNLKCIFTSKYGINIRNDIAHGILDDSEFKSSYAVYAWWFILKLCCIYSPWIMLREKK